MAVPSECLTIRIVLFLVAGMTLDFMRIGFKNVWLLLAFAPALCLLARMAGSQGAVSSQLPTRW
jgi:hypothetical protein